MHSVGKRAGPAVLIHDWTAIGPRLHNANAKSSTQVSSLYNHPFGIPISLLFRATSLHERDSGLHCFAAKGFVPMQSRTLVSTPSPGSSGLARRVASKERFDCLFLRIAGNMACGMKPTSNIHDVNDSVLLCALSRPCSTFFVCFRDGSTIRRDMNSQPSTVRAPRILLLTYRAVKNKRTGHAIE